MKKVYFIVAILVSLLVFTGCTQFLDTNGINNNDSFQNALSTRSIEGITNENIVNENIAYDYQIVAGQNQYIGQVNVYNDEDNIYVEFFLNDSWVALESHFDINKTDYVPGKYQFGESYNPGTSYDIFVVPIPEEDIVIINLHLSVVNVVTGQSETAWGVKLTNYVPGSEVPQRDSSDTLFTTKEVKGKWYGYIVYEIQDVSEPPVEYSSETAWAVGNETFINLGISTRWGWVITFDGNSLRTPIYAAAGRNDITKGTLVGYLDISFADGNLNISYSFNDIYYADVLHLFVGSVYPDTAAPGQYPYIIEDNNIESYSFSIPLDYVPDINSPVYIAAHSNVYPF